MFQGLYISLEAQPLPCGSFKDPESVNATQRNNYFSSTFSALVSACFFFPYEPEPKITNDTAPHKSKKSCVNASKISFLNQRVSAPRCSAHQFPSGDLSPILGLGGAAADESVTQELEEASATVEYSAASRMESLL